MTNFNQNDIVVINYKWNHINTGVTCWFNNNYISTKLNKLIVDFFINANYYIINYDFYHGQIKDTLTKGNMSFIKIKEKIDHDKCVEIYNKLLSLK